MEKWKNLPIFVGKIPPIDSWKRGRDQFNFWSEIAVDTYYPYQSQFLLVLLKILTFQGSKNFKVKIPLEFYG